MMKQILLICIALLLLGSALNAHPPDSIKAVYNKENGQLSITIEHPSKDAASHFINEILIRINGKKRLSHHILFQESMQQQKALYRFSDIQPGDEIEITAVCNVFGKKRIIFEVGE